MDRLSDIALSLYTLVKLLILVVSCLIIMVTPVIALVITVLLLLKALGPVVGFLTALTMSVALGLMLQDLY